MGWAGLLRFGAAVVGAAAFGLVAGPLLPFHPLIAAFVLAFCFGFFFLLGTGYRILFAAFTGRQNGSPGASWTGACFVSSSAAALAAGIFEVTAGGGILVIAAYAIALNVAYGMVKLACARAGCCAAVRPAVKADLRLIEAGLTALVAITTFTALGQGFAAVAALFGIAGHLGVRSFSRWARDRWPVRPMRREGVGHEMLALALLLSAIPAIQFL